MIILILILIWAITLAVGFLGGRIYTLEHETKTAIDGWRVAMSDHLKTLQLISQTEFKVSGTPIADITV